MKRNGKVTLTVPVTNTGSRSGEEIVQVYVKALDYPEAPIKSLRGFKKLSLAPGQTGKAVITLDGESFEYYDPSIDELSTRPGRYQILYGCSSRDEDLQKLDFVVK
jgi:beta-glucosidase